MIQGYRVDAAALDAHVRTVAAIAERMRMVAEAGRPLGLGAYGLVGQLFAQTASLTVAVCSAAAGELSREAEGLGEAVRATHEAYLAAERRNAASFEELR